MSLSTVMAGLKERFQTIDGLAQVLDYEPTSIQAWPTLYSLLDDFEISRSGQIVRTQYRILHRVLFRWQDNEAATAEMVPFADAIVAAVAADPHLGGRLTSGYAEITEGETMWVEIGGIQCLALDLYSTVIEK